MALSNYQIEEFCRQLHLPLVGVFSKDLLPNKRSIGSYYVNMENSVDKDGKALVGSHWLFVRIFSNKSAIYFDSYGVDMPEEVREFLLPFNPIPFNNRDIQSMKSEHCGYYCLACDVFFSYDQNKTLSILDNYDHFLSMWSSKPDANDSILFEYLQK
jgi:hypothetical protein